MKKIEKVSWEEQDKDGMILNGFVKANNTIIREIINKYDIQASMVYIIILSHRHDTTNKCYPSLDLIARECNLSVRTITNVIKKLVDGKYLIVDSGKQGISNTYYFPREQCYGGEGIGATKRSKGNFKNKNTKEE